MATHSDLGYTFNNVNQLSAISDADEGYAYAGSYGRVTSERIGRDLNPLVRGDGSAYVGGGEHAGMTVDWWGEDCRYVETP